MGGFAAPGWQDRPHDRAGRMSSRPKFPQVEYADSTGALRQCYDDMQGVLRVPWVMFAARALAVFGGVRAPRMGGGPTGLRDEACGARG